MAVNTVSVPFVVLAARAAMEGRSAKGQRPEAALAFINANSLDEREQAVTEFGAGFVRRGLHEQAVAFKVDEEVANVFEMLRDSIDMDGTVHDALLDTEDDSSDDDNA
jgi:hypothetical protein